MKHRFIVYVFLSLGFCLDLAAENNLLSRLDKTISRREEYISNKEARLDSLRRLAATESSSELKLDVYNQLFNEYLAFSFDSAMAYVNRAEEIAEQINNYDIRSQVNIHRALSLATSGHFSHAVTLLKAIDSHKLSCKTKEEYFAACQWAYGVWAEYSDKHTIAPEFVEKSAAYLDSLIAVTVTDTPEYTYRMAEKALRSNEFNTAKELYTSVLDSIDPNSRLYAQSTYALAQTYKELNDMPRYKEYLIRAAISDQTIPLKENLALQQLALYIEQEEGDVVRANEYLKLALEDAIFYNNRLRMLEIAEKIPDIAIVYQKTIEQQNERLKIFLLIIGILMLALLVIAIYIYRSRSAFKELNRKLKELNDRLSRTNDTREQYVSLFMDLCAAYIEKLNRFPMILKLKVKTLADVSSVADRYVRPTETETREMFFNFDTAFLQLYPDFISEFNSLLKPDKQIVPKKGELLNTDLRIYALVRMGVSDSNKIASLLFLSPQTIFNHRTQVRNRAINRETFERELSRICGII